MIGFIARALPAISNVISKIPSFLANVFSKVNAGATKAKEILDVGKKVVAIASGVPVIAEQLKKTDEKLKEQGVDVGQLVDQAEKISTSTAKVTGDLSKVLAENFPQQ